MFHVSIPKMVRLIVFLKLEYKEMVLGFNSKDGAIDSAKSNCVYMENPSFNSKDGAIDRVVVILGVEAHIPVSIPKMVRLIAALQQYCCMSCITFQFQRWCD